MSKNECYILGYGNFGSYIAKYLTNKELDVIVIDNDPDVVQTAANKYTHAIKADIKDIDALRETNISKAKCIIVCITDLHATVAACANLIELGCDGKIIARAENDLNKRILNTLGIKNVIVPVHDAAFHAALQALYNFNEEIHNLPNGLCWTTVTISNKRCTNVTIKELDLRNKLGVNILYLIHNGITQPLVDPKAKLGIGDVIAFICPTNLLDNSISYFTNSKSKEKFKYINLRNDEEK